MDSVTEDDHAAHGRPGDGIEYAEFCEFLKNIVPVEVDVKDGFA
jgi:hypothetical protein